jgi:hypothetical protein
MRTLNRESKLLGMLLAIVGLTFDQEQHAQREGLVASHGHSAGCLGQQALHSDRRKQVG